MRGFKDISSTKKKIRPKLNKTSWDKNNVVGRFSHLPLEEIQWGFLRRETHWVTSTNPFAVPSTEVKSPPQGSTHPVTPWLGGPSSFFPGAVVADCGLGVHHFQTAALVCKFGYPMASCIYGAFVTRSY